MTDSTRTFARQLERMERAARAKGSTPQLGFSSIENGQIYEYDINGVLKQRIGRQGDGTNTTAQFNGPVPPEPTKPTIELSDGAVRVSWDGLWVSDAVAPMDLSRIDVHFIDDLSDDPMEMPPRGSILAQGWGDVALPLIPGEYHAVLVARTQSGNFKASEPSDAFTVVAITAGTITETEIADDSISTPKLQANSVVTDKVAAGAVTANEIAAGAVTADKLEAVLAIIGKLQAGGNVEIGPPTNTAGVLGGGIVVYDPTTHEVLVRLHPDGCTFRGQVTTDILTVLQDLVINGDASLSSGATLVLENGVSDPSAGPTWTQGPITSAWPAVDPATYYVRGVAWDSVNSHWVRLLENIGNHRAYVQIVDLSGNQVGSIYVLGESGLAAGESDVLVNGITVIGTLVYYVRTLLSGGVRFALLTECTLSSGAYVRNKIIGSDAAYGPATIYHGVGNDGANVLVAGRGLNDGGSVGSGAHSYVAKYDSVSLSQIGRTVQTNQALDAVIRHVSVGNFGYGVSRLSIGSSYTMSVYQVPAYAAGEVTTTDASLDWFLIDTLNNGGIDWKTGADSGFYSSHNDLKLSRWSNYYNPGEAFYGQYADYVGSNHTGSSPVTSITLGNRLFPFATLRPSPPGATSSKLWTGYGASTPSTYYLRSESISGRTFALTNLKDVSGSTSVPVGNNAGGSPSELEAEAGGFVVRGDSSGDWPALRAMVGGGLASRYRSTVQALAPSTTTFTTIDFDTAIATDTVIPWDTTNKVFTATKTGRYHVSLDVRSQISTATYFILRALVNTDQVCRTLSQPAVGWAGIVLTKTIYMDAGDTLTLQAQMQAGTGGVFGDVNQDTNVSVAYIGV